MAGNSSDYLIEAKNVWVEYPTGKGDSATILNNVNLSIRQGEFITVVGPSGCGKSTLLRLILGAEAPTRGSVLVEGKTVFEPNRHCGIVYQKYSLFPHLTVLENIVFGLDLEEFSMSSRALSFLRYRKRKKDFAKQAREYLERMGLAEAADKYPQHLSGGMRQRVAIAQTAIMNPRIMLMDEPFGALDDATRQQMQLFILELWSKYKMTILFVTHDLPEALYLGTRIIVLSQYYTADDERGAKIVTDKEIPGKHPKPSSYRSSEEFVSLLEKVRRDGLDPEVRQHVKDFDLSHRDAWRPENRDL